MSSDLPFGLIYNLNRLGQTGDEIVFSASAVERAGLARLIEALDVVKFDARISLKKTAPNQFAAQFDLAADIVQACVVTLEPVPAHIQTGFRRELHFTPNLRRVEKDVVVAPEDDEAPEEIESLHYDLAGPLTEEFVLSVDPYPRAPGVEFHAPAEVDDKPESPFAVLKDLKSGQKTGK